MHELSRMAYLDALGIDSYISRQQLPGAAPTRRLVVVPSPAAKTTAGETGASRAPATSAADTGIPRPRVSVGSLDRPKPVPGATPAPARQREAIARFSLTTIVAGSWLWLEDLDGMPLTTAQVHLVQSMAQAMQVMGGSGDDRKRPDIAQFDWPIHTNRQLDLGQDAARASVAGFVARRLEQHGCRGLVLLGQAGASWVPAQEMAVPVVSTLSTAQMLAEPQLKRQVWQALLPLVETV
jgi:hypothetical protein